MRIDVEEVGLSFRAVFNRRSLYLSGVILGLCHEFKACIKCGEFVDWLVDCQRLRDVYSMQPACLCVFVCLSVCLKNVEELFMASPITGIPARHCGPHTA